VASNEQIKVEITAAYDDKGAKAAKADLDALDGREAEATVDVDDNASRDIDKVDSKLDGVDGREAEATLDVDDNASRDIDKVDSKLDAVDGRTAEATVDVDTGAGFADVAGQLDEIDGGTYKATVDAGTGAGLTDVVGDLKEIDGGTYKATVDAGTGAGLTDVVGDLKEIDGGTYKATVDAGQGAGLTDVVGDLKEIDGGTYKATIDADEGTGLGRVKTTLSTMAGHIQGMAGHIDALSGPTGLVAALAGGLLGAANKAADVAIEAQKISTFTGASVEDASTLAAVLRDSTSIEADDLLDIIAQMSGVFAGNPALAAQFGTSLDEVRKNPLAAFITAVNTIGADGVMSFDEMLGASQVFGEEGVRQINEIIAAVGPQGLSAAMQDVADTRIVSQADVDAAREMKARLSELTGQLQGMAVTIGSEVVPVLADMLGTAEDVGGALNTVAELGQQGTARSVWDFINQFPSAKFNEIYDALNAAGVSAEDFRDNAFDLDDAIALIAQGIPPDVISQANLTADAQKYLAEQTDAAAAAAEAQADGADDMVSAEAEMAAAAAEATRKLEAQRDAHQQAAEAAEEQVDALTSANDVYYAQRDAVRDADEAVGKYHETLEDGTVEDQEQALDDLTQAFDDVAQANIDVARQQRATRGQTLTLTEALDIQNESLIEQAATLNGDEREALVNHIARLNSIPPSVASEILTLIDEGKLDEANQLLEDTSRTRTATYKADVENASATATQRELDNLTKPRTVTITVNTRPGSNTGIGGGGPIAAPSMVPIPAVAAAGGDTYNLNLPRGTRIDDTVRSLDRHARRNGRRPYAFRR
jgi:hypothetical protein